MRGGTDPGDRRCCSRVVGDVGFHGTSEPEMGPVLARVGQNWGVESIMTF